jgi:hypothetical protein
VENSSQKMAALSSYASSNSIFSELCVLFLKSYVLPKTDVEEHFFKQQESSCHVLESNL